MEMSDKTRSRSLVSSTEAQGANTVTAIGTTAIGLAIVRDTKGMAGAILTIVDRFA